MYASDTSGALLGELDLRSGVGDVALLRVRAERIQIQTTGSVKAHVEVSDSLDIDSPVYVISDDLSS